MVQRNDAADAGRKGEAAHTKQTHGHILEPQIAKGEWLPAYSGGMGQTAAEIDPEIGTAGEEVGNDSDTQ